MASDISDSLNDFNLNQISASRQDDDHDLTQGLDLNEDFASDASDDKKKSMKKATYEMD